MVEYGIQLAVLSIALVDFVKFIKAFQWIGHLNTSKSIST